jgi:hypothetical protein
MVVRRRQDRASACHKWDGNGIKQRFFADLPLITAQKGYLAPFYQARQLIKSASFGRMVFFALQHKRATDRNYFATDSQI